MKFFQEKKPRSTPGRSMTLSSLEVLENNFAALRAEQITLEERLATLQAEELAVRSEVSQLVDSLIVGTGDAATLQAARERLIAISEQVAVLAGQLAQAKQLTARAETLLAELRILGQTQERDALDHRFRAAVRRAAPALAAAAVAMTELAELSDLAFSTYPVHSQPGAPPIFFDVAPLHMFTLRGRTRIVQLLEGIKRHDGVGPEAQAAIDQAAGWEAEQAAITRRRELGLKHALRGARAYGVRAGRDGKPPGLPGQAQLRSKFGPARARNREAQLKDLPSPTGIACASVRAWVFERVWRNSCAR